jgi:hypothetical protein
MIASSRSAFGSLVCAVVAAPLLVAQSARDTSTRIAINGFVDTYYAFDATRPPDGERLFTTQPIRHDEFNVNLAWLGVTIARPRTRARFAMQAGTSVQANYAAEPRNGATSGPGVSQFIQEAVVGYRLRNALWLDAGIYSSYIGLESWTSADNLTYTRSLVADYSPYYLSGAKLTWQATPKLAAQLHVTNGWQNISENNRSKAIGVRLDYAVSPSLALSYANFLGNERGEGSARATRMFNQVMAKGRRGRTEWQAQLDAGTEGGEQWYGAVAAARRSVTSRLALVARAERYADPDEVIVSTALPNGFVGNGGSIGVDVTLDDGLRWRSEARVIRADAALYARDAMRTPTQTNALFVTSVSLAF